MKINSGKKAVVVGLVCGTCIFVAYVLFTCFMHYLLGGEHFVHKDETRTVINGVSFNAVRAVAVAISAVIPILLIRYKDIGNYGISIFVMAGVYVFYLVGGFALMSSMPLEAVLSCPMNSLDAILVYGISSFPLGAFMGILVNAGINFLINKRKNI